MVFCLLMVSTAKAQQTKSLDPQLAVQVKQTLKENAALLQFVQNKGQLKIDSVLYYLDSKHGTIYIEKDQIKFVAKEYINSPAPVGLSSDMIAEQDPLLISEHAFAMRFKNANASPKVRLGEQFSTKFNYFMSKNPNDWVTGVQAAKELTIEDIYDGVDLRIYSNTDGSLEFDWIVDNALDFQKIQMEFDGQDKLKVDKKGNLAVQLRFADVKFNIPEAYQVGPQGKIPVLFAFDKIDNKNIQFKNLSPLNEQLPLIIDPVLIWGTYMDGNGTNGNNGNPGATFDQYLYAIQLDTLTNIMYCAGATNLAIPTGTAPYDANGWRNIITGLDGGSNNNEYVTVIYRINSAGNDLLDLTLYGNNSSSNNETSRAHSLSLSPNRVFVGGFTNHDLPMTGSPFDATRGFQDAYVAVFSKNLDTFHYASYLGSTTGNETFGTTSIQAIDDYSYVLGFTPDAALPAATPNYTPDASAYDITFNGVYDIFICKFTNLNTMSWGTYVGGTQGDTLNDLEIIPNGKIIFAGWTQSTITEVNGAGASGANTDGLIGILSSNGHTMDYLDKLGGANRDRIFDVEWYSGVLYFTGAVGTGFPLGTGTKYDDTYNGGSNAQIGFNVSACDAIIGRVDDTGGSANYKATYYGPPGNGLTQGSNSNDLGNGIKQVTTGGCGGNTSQTFILVWGTVTGDSLPTKNLNNESFFDSLGTNGGVDMFFAGFKNTLDTLVYATYVGGNNNDYLGNIGDPRGANHLFVYGSNIYVGTTTHSDGNNAPTYIQNGFDISKSNGTNDSHCIFEIEIASIVETDFSDAPLWLGKPLHTILCNDLRIGPLIDAESSSQHTKDADGDDTLGSDDEDGVPNPPSLTAGTNQNISITVDSIKNTTGNSATLYAWINLNGDNMFGFEVAEARTATIPNGFNGSVTLNWNGVTVSGPDTNKYLRLRLTTNNLIDNAATPRDERAYSSASNGEVEDYSLVELNCPAPGFDSACVAQDTINAHFDAWLLSASGGGGCDGVLTNNNSGPPDYCGDTATVTFFYVSTCAPDTTMCTSTYTILVDTSVPNVVLTCPMNLTISNCQTQTAVDDAFDDWLNTAMVAGGCSTILSNNNTGAPSKCGGSTTVTFTVNSGCEPPVTCSAIFTVTTAPSATITCPSNQTEGSCQTQASIDAAYTAWLNSASFSGGCPGGVLSNNGGSAPSNCGGSKTVTWTLNSLCDTLTCTSVFTVTAAPVVTITCASNNTQASCQTQAAIDAAYTSWLNTATFSGGCNAAISNNGGSAPPACGGSKTVTWTVTSLCQANVSCSAVFTVNAAPLLTLFCPINVTEASCQTQASINTKFTNWLNSVSSTGGCFVGISNNNSGAPSACGGAVTVTFTATSACEAPKTCSAVFTVTAAPGLSVTCATNTTQAACQTQAAIDAAYTAWLATTTTSGGCNVNISHNGGSPPNFCGGSKTVTWTITSTCAATTTCSAVFTVTATPNINLTCATNTTHAPCQSQATIDAAYAAWLASATFTGGCNAAISNNGGSPPSACGGTKTVTWTVTSSCQADVTCSAIFSVSTAASVALTCATNNTQTACQSQAAINAAYTAWLASSTFTGGCNATISNNGGSAPFACGGSKTVTWTVTSTCDTDKTCSAVFTVSAATPVSLTCAINNTQAACQTQAAIDAAYATWLTSATFTGGCNAAISNNGGSAPPACGGSKTVTWTVTSTCDVNKTCSAVFTVTDAPVIALTCANNNTQASCQSQAAIDAAYASWLTSTSFTGGCNATMSNDGGSAPPACGGSKTVTWTVTSTCEVDRTCSAVFTVTTAPAVVLNCPMNVSEPACQSKVVIEGKFNTWLNSVSFSGGCNASISNNNSGDFPPCGGGKTVTWTVTSSCESPVTCSASFTVEFDTIVPTFTKPADVTIYKGNDNPDTTTLVNYSFNSGTSYDGLCPELFAGIASEVDASSNVFKTDIGVASGSLAYTQNTIGGSALLVDSSHTSGHWQFNLTGENLPKATDIAVYIQARKNGINSADNLVLQYSLNGTTWTTFRTKALTLATWIQDTATITGVANPDSLFLRVTYSGGNTGSNPKSLLLDNFQVRANMCCVFDASPNKTGDVTDEFDSCNPDIEATYCDSIVNSPCEGSHIIYRTWTLMDSCGNTAPSQLQTITVSDSSRPTFMLPPNVTIYQGTATTDTFTLVNYDFNNGTSYSKLSPKLHFGITSKIDTTSNPFKLDSGTVTGTLAFTNNPIARWALRVDTSNNPGYWQFNIKGGTLPICSEFEIYTQTYKKDENSSDTIYYYYSIDSVVWNKFHQYTTLEDVWVQDTAKLPITTSISNLYIRVTYSDTTGPEPSVLLMDNFQLRAIIEYDSCSVNPSPDITGYPTDLEDNCDTIPTLTYVDEIIPGTCPDNYTIERNWIAYDNCENTRTEIQLITIEDTTRPTIICPGNIVTIDCEANTSPDSTGYASSTDLCSEDVTDIEYTDNIIPGTCPGDFTIERTWTATDSCDNEVSCIQTINVDPLPGPTINCPSSQTHGPCQTQSAIDAAYAAWLASATFDGGCDSEISNNGGSAPPACGGTKTVTWTVTSSCSAPVTCTRIFSVSGSPTINLTCATNSTQAACQTQSAIDAAYASWLTSASFTGGCNAAISNNGGSAPLACGGSKTVTWTVTSTCEPNVTCSAVFTVTAAPVINLTCAANNNQAACQTQSAIDAAYASWLATATFTGGCNAVISNNGGSAPPACGGSKTVTWTVTSSCEPDVTCSAVFTVADAPMVNITCPSNNTQAACQTQAVIDAAFTSWLGSASFTGGCNAMLSNSGGSAPPACGGSTTVTWTVTSSCQTPVSCSAVFTVTNAPAVVLNCAANTTQAACQTQAAIDAAYSTWLSSASFTGGCNAAITNNGGSAPPACGGSKTVTWTVTSTCEPNVTCSAVFTVTDAPVVNLTCASNNTQAACQTQAAIDAAYSAWLATATFTGGCNATISNDGGTAPLACGGSKTVTWTVTSSCETPVTCSAVFTVTNAPVVNLTCATNNTQAACQTQSAIDAAYATWLASATFTGGCNAMISNNGGSAPPACGGAKTVTWTVTSTCEPNVTCSAVFTVTNAPVVNLTCATNNTQAACQTQAAIDAAYTTWLASATFTGGCNAVISNNGGSAPPACGGSKTVTWTVTSSCEANVTCSAVFTVTNAPVVNLTCATNNTQAACQTQAAIDAAYSAWLATATFTGGCNAVISNNGGSAPPACGGSKTVTWTVTSSCEGPVTCSAVFTVTDAPVVNLTCATNNTQGACQTQAAIDAAYSAWLATATFTGGCNAAISNNGGAAPDACGGSKTVTWTVTSTCETPVTCSAVFTVTSAPVVNLTCASNNTQAACQTQAAIDAAYTTWLATATFTGGCNAAISNNGGSAPPACGGSKTVTWTVTSSCEPDVTCSAVFTVTAAPNVVLTCPTNNTQAACQTQAAIDAAYTTWLTTVSFSGGCNAAISNNAGPAPAACGGSVTVTWTVTSSCQANVTCSATFTVTNAPNVVLSCASNSTQAACQTQAAIDAAYASWLATASFTGGCNAAISNNGGSAPLACGGSKTVTWTVTSSCQMDVTCSAVFTVTAAPNVNLTCAPNRNRPSCLTQTNINNNFANWLLLATFSGGCNATITNDNTGPPDRCGGSTTVTWTVTSSCQSPVTCSATYTVTAAPPVVLTCATNLTVAACQTQADVNTAFTNWLATASFSGGCNATMTNNNTGAPPACGGSTTVTWTVTSSCQSDVTCSAVFSVTNAPSVVLNCPSNQTEAACQTQAAINTAFANWLATATTSGGCNASMTNNNTGAPPACGGSTTVTWTVTSTCEANSTCSAVFTVTDAPLVNLTCAINNTQAACQTQAAIDAAYSAWLATATFTGGCNATISNNGGSAPPACGGSKTVTWTVTSTCEPDVTCSAVFTVTDAPAVVLTCPGNQTEAACQTQAAIDNAFATWLTTVSFSGGCNATLSNNNTGAPPACGGSTTVTWTVTSSCEPNVTCSATFTVTDAPVVVLTCPANQTVAACQTQAAVDAAYTAWLTTVSFSGGCNATLTNNSPGAPPACGGSVTVTWTVTSSCEPNVTCAATFTVTDAPVVVLSCASNQTEAACQTQTAINNAFTAWLATTTFTGGCNATISNDNTGAPLACGGSTTVTWTVTSSCEPNVTCSAVFTVTNAPLVNLTCAANQTEAACQTQGAIDAAYTAWLNSASFTGGCNGMISNNGGSAPPICGGSKTVTWTVTSSCEPNVTCSAVFTVTAAPAVVLNCASNQTEAACQTQSAIDAAYTAWLASATFTGGCNAMISNNGGSAPPACGGSKTVTWTVTSSCEAPVSCSAVFTVTAAPTVSINCAGNQTEAACQTQAAIDAAYATWLASASFTGGCNAAISNDGGSAPPACGGSKTVTWTVTSTCQGPVTCTAVFTVLNAPIIALTCATNNTQAACQTQAAIDAAYTAWLATATFTGGCNATISNDGGSAPDACGGSKTVTWTVTSTCEPDVSCSAVFTVLDAPMVTLTCPTNQTQAACQTQTAIDNAFNAWLATAGFTGGCFATLNNNNTGAPPACGGSTTVTFTVTSSCETDVSCSAVFTVTDAPLVVLNCPANQTVGVCQTQAAVDAAYAAWLTTVSFSGGCNAAISNNSTGAPPACGGSVTVTWTVTSSCEPNVTCAAIFTVTDAPPVVLNCPANQTEAPCQTQTAIDNAFSTWLTTVSFSGGCNASISNGGGSAPSACGGSTTVTWTVTSTCESPVTCSAVFTVTDAPLVNLTCANNQTEPACQTQAAIDAAYAAWLATATFTGGCNGAISNNGGSAPPICGGSKTVTWTVTSSCEPNVTCSAVFTVTAAPAVVLNCASNQTEAACQTQTAIDAAYTTWLASATFTGGCNAMISNDGGSAPPACGGSKTVTWTVTSTCEVPVTCSAVFTVTNAPVINLSCASNQTEAACQTQGDIDNAYANWLATATFTGGCNAMISNDGGSAPPACGGSKTVTWTVTSSCESPVTCSAVFTVTNAPLIALTCATNNTQAACQTQAAIDAAYTAWLATATFTGGCNATISNDGGSAPNACGGSKTVTWTVTSSCEPDVTCSAVFTVLDAPLVTLTCPANQTVAACQTQTAVDNAYNTWLTTVSFSGGCFAAISNNSAGAPPACGGSVTVTWTVTSSCEPDVTCAAIFTVTDAPPVVLNCPTNQTVAACQTQTDVNNAYNAWLTTVSFSGGCNAAISNNASGAPPACGGSTTVTWTVTSSCEVPVSCSASFTVSNAPVVVISCPANQTEPPCQTQAAINAAFTAWVASGSFSGGCNGMISNNAGIAPPECGGSTTVTWTVTSTCESPVTCSAVFTVTDAPAVVLTCPSSQTEPACQTQAAIDGAYTAWLNSATFSGGCNSAISNDGGSAPPICGGSKTVTWTVTSSCTSPVTCSAVFTVTNAPAVNLNCAVNQTEAACQTQGAIDAAYTTWLASATFTGGCNAMISNDGGSAPPACGGSKTVTWTVTSSCESPVTCSAVFTVSNAPVINLSCASNQTEAACQTQSDIDNAYNNWLATATFTGGCNAMISNDGGSAPPACGGSKTVTWTVTSSCESPVTCSAVFTVTNAPAVNITCAVNQTQPACLTQAAIDAAYTAWLATATFTGGCNAMISNDGGSAPPACGGSKTVTWTVTSSCEGPVTCTAVFTVTDAPAVVLTCPANQTEPACQTQAAIDATYATWLTTVSFSGGCNAAISNNSPGAPPACGGSVTVTWTVTSSCEADVTCAAVFTVTDAPAVVLTCPVNQTFAACQTQTDVDNAYNAWLSTVSFSGGCNAAISNNAGSAPPACGGSTTVTWTVTSSCEVPVTCTASFTVTSAPAVVLTCPANQTEPACQTQAAIDAAYATWLTTVSFSGGCSAAISNNSPGAPLACGGSVTVIWTVTSSCEVPVTCTASFTVTNAPAVVLNCPSNQTEAACQTQAAIDAAYTAWLASATFSGGCNAAISNDGGSAPPACGGSKTVTWTVTSTCEGSVTCSAVFTVTNAPAVVLNCAANQTEAACQTQSAIDAAYTTWLASATFTGGCSAMISNDGGSAPPACGGSKTVTWTVTSTCESPVTCSAVFTVTNAPAVALTCPANQTEPACQTQAAIDAAFNTWLNSATFSGGCNATLSNSGGAAPNACGGSTTVTWTVTSSCESPVTCSAVFTVLDAPPIVLNCAVNQTEPACQTQTAIDAAYTAWLATATFTGGCNAAISNDGGSAPPACGGSKTVTWTVTSSCGLNVSCSAVFTVTDAPAVVLNCPSNQTEPACQTQAAIDAAYATWLTTVSFSGGCNAAISNNSPGAPPACGGSVTVTWTVTSTCEGPVTCSASFTVTNAPAVVLNCPTNQTVAACQTQTDVDNAYNAWLTTVSFSGGCNAAISNNAGPAPNACGGSTTVTWTVTSSCEGPVTCSASFTVTDAPAVVLTCPVNQNVAACQTQTDVDNAYNAWLTTVSFSGGCNAAISNNSAGAPPACGGSVTVTWTVTSSCQMDVTCSASFSVTMAPAVALNCAVNQTEPACQTQTAVDAAFNIWLNSATFSGGCNSMISNNGGAAPNACGGSTTVTWTVTSTCEVPVTCSAVFTVTAAPAVVLNCAANQTESACQTQASIDAAFNTWLNSATFSGGCNSMISNNGGAAPNACGGSTTVTWTVTSTCEGSVTCSAVFTVTAAPAVVLNCAVNHTEPACQTQAAIDTAYSNWLATATFTGGCNAMISNDGGSAPPACGGSKTVSWTVTSTCEGPVTCSAVFTVLDAPPIVLNCASNQTEPACQTQSAIDAAYTAWLATATFTGGCNANISNNGGSAPPACGGSKTVTWTVTNTCGPDVTCSAVFTVTDAPAVVLTCPVNQTVAACQTQTDVDNAYNAWLTTVSFSGGCSASISNNSSGAPPACGGSVTVTWTVTSTCESDVTCAAVFTVTNAPAVVLTCPVNQTFAACQTQTDVDNAYNAWLTTVSFSGGCNAAISNNAGPAPNACGGSTTVTWTVTSSCEGPVTCSASFTVTDAPAVVVTCPVNQNIAACQTQTDVDNAYNAWLTTVSFSGGCNAAISNNSAGAPPACGGSVTVTWTVTSSCQMDVTCSASFTVTAAPAVALTCPPNRTRASCLTQTNIDNNFANWLTLYTLSGGCNASITNDNSGPPNRCGGSTTVTFTVTSSCEGPVTCSASYTVTAAPAVALNCAVNNTQAACQTQTAIDNAFATWLASATFSGGCDAAISNTNTGAPPACGGSTTVTWTVTSSCEGPVTCSASFTVTAAPPVTLTCPSNQTEAACQTQAAIDAAYTAWLNSASSSGGCFPAISHDGGSAPPACGGSKTVTWTVTSTCEPNSTCSAVFTVTAAPVVSLSCPANQTEPACQTQAAIDAAYTAWLNSASSSGGCFPAISHDGGSAPPACGGSKTVTWTVTSTCEGPVTCSAIFTVTDAPAITLTCPANQTEPACQTQAAIDAAYATWLTTVSFSGGCNAAITNNSSGAPLACGGSVTVTWTVTSTCAPNLTCSAVFTVSNAPAVVLTCPVNQTFAACQTQTDVDNAYNAWLTTVSFSGGCNAAISNNAGPAPNACGGSTTVTWTVTSSCEGPVTCSASFTVTDAPAVVLTCPVNQNVAACQTQTDVDNAYNAWLTTVSFSGGCNAAISNNSAGAPPACGGSVTVTWTVTSSCQMDVTCSASFTVTAAPAVALTCPPNRTRPFLPDSNGYRQCSFAAWLAAATSQRWL
ncbi:MAG: hypothetical protein IPM34_07795 [Saprospiraceae bacterium]|nr:hypothetical protein [Saprospiraceae bacterium]